ncbi:MAG: hypothetical protein ACOCV2_05420, partial [Persicimonas sp.]
GVAGDPGGLGFFGYAYYEQNKDSLKSVAIKADEDAEAVKPAPETISEGTYTPLFRPLFIYVNKDEYEDREEIQEFVEFYLTDGTRVVEEVGYIELPERGYKLALERVQDGVTGSVFEDSGPQIGVTVEELLGGDEEADDADEDEKKDDDEKEDDDEKDDEKDEDKEEDEGKKDDEGEDE